MSNPIGFSPAIPIVRSFDEAKAREFYCDYLGFSVDWEHRFGPDFPLYMQISRGLLILHISEHHGDATPGGNMVVPIQDAAAFHAELSSRFYKNLRPGIEDQPWGREITVIDPFGNRMRFLQGSN